MKQASAQLWHPRLQGPGSPHHEIVILRAGQFSRGAGHIERKPVRRRKIKLVAKTSKSHKALQLMQAIVPPPSDMEGQIDFSRSAHCGT